jgi:hypothetical protein
MINFIQPTCSSVTIKGGLVPQVTACQLVSGLLMSGISSQTAPQLGKYVNGFWTVNGQSSLPFLYESYLGTIEVLS